MRLEADGLGQVEPGQFRRAEDHDVVRRRRSPASRRRSPTLSPAAGSTRRFAAEEVAVEVLDRIVDGERAEDQPVADQPLLDERGIGACSSFGRLAVARRPSSAPCGVRCHVSGGLASGQRPVPLPRQPVTGSAANAARAECQREDAEF